MRYADIVYHTSQTAWTASLTLTKSGFPGSQLKADTTEEFWF